MHPEHRLSARGFGHLRHRVGGNWDGIVCTGDLGLQIRKEFGSKLIYGGVHKLDRVSFVSNIHTRVWLTRRLASLTL